MVSRFASNMTVLSLNFSISSHLDRAQQLFFKIPFDVVASWVRNCKWFLDIYRILRSIAFKVLCSLVSTSIYHASYPIILLQKSSSLANLAHSNPLNMPVGFLPEWILLVSFLSPSGCSLAHICLFKPSASFVQCLSNWDCFVSGRLCAYSFYKQWKGNFRAPREQDQWYNIPFLLSQMILGFFPYYFH